LFSKRLIYKHSIVAKLRSIGADDMAKPLAKCHTEESFAQCTGCKKVRTFWNRCENFYCPTCQPVLARERAESIRWWVNQIDQPKHIVLTARNTADLTFGQVSRFKAALVKLRRRKIAKAWRGGLWSLEVTNEGRGWHLHAHLLVDAHWIDKGELSRQWGDLVGQDFAIVAIKDARGADYLKEVTKYAVKGSMLAAWQPNDIATFVNAFHGQRTFGVFGSLYGKRTQWRDWLKTLLGSKRKCECGCDTFEVYSADDWKRHERFHAIDKGLAPPFQRAYRPHIPELTLALT